MKLRIKEWERQFELPGHRPQKALRFLALPVRSEGTGFRRMSVAEQDNAGAVFFGLWCLILLATAELELGQRGLVIRLDGTPHDAASLHARYGFATLAAWEEAIAFFLRPEVGWLIDEEAKAQTQAPKVVSMPLPKIEEPNIYELAADRMIARYVNADAPVDRIPDTATVAKAIMFRLMPSPPDQQPFALETMEANQEAYIGETKAKYLERLDRWISGGLSLATRKGPKKYERGTREALILTEVRANRMTPEQAREQGVEV